MATRVIGDIFHFKAFKIIHIILCGCLGLTWIVLFVLTLVAFKRGYILESDPEDVLKDAIYTHGIAHDGEAEKTNIQIPHTPQLDEPHQLRRADSSV